MQICDINMDDWNEVKIAAVVAAQGTISAAAKALGVHRATVIRNVDQLEKRLGQKLFQRHSRGMQPTDLGRRLLTVADATHAQFGELYREAKGQSGDLSGELVITSVDVLSPLVLPLIERFQQKYPATTVRYMATDQVLKLSYGEADIAFRIGPKPQTPDNVVRPFTTVEMGIYAAQGYIQAYGRPASLENVTGHRWIGPNDQAPTAPFIEWIRRNIPDNQISIKANSVGFMWLAVTSGIGIGFLPDFLAHSRTDLVEIHPPKPEWREPTWIVTHVDLHRSRKVQAFCRLLEAEQPKRPENLG